MRNSTVLRLMTTTALLALSSVVSCTQIPPEVTTSPAQVHSAPEHTATPQQATLPPAQASPTARPTSTLVTPIPACKAGLLAFAANTNFVGDDYYRVYVACSDGSFVQPVASFDSGGDIRDIALSGDNTSLIILHGPNEIDTLDLTTSRLTTIFSSDDELYALSPSPDGQYLIIGRLSSDRIENIISLHIATGVVSPLIMADPPKLGTSLTDPGWSPDGKDILFRTSYESGPQQVAYDVKKATIICDAVTHKCSTGSLIKIDWADKARRAVSWSPSSDIVMGYYDIDLKTYDIDIRRQDGKVLRDINLTSLIPMSGFYMETIPPVISPDGERIAFFGSDSDSDVDRALFVLNLSSMTVQQIPGTGTQKMGAYTVAWLPASPNR